MKKQQISGFIMDQPTIYHTQGQHDNYYTTDVVQYMYQSKESMTYSINI